MREVISYSFVMPPTVFIALCLIGALISLTYPRIGMRIVLVSAILLYLFATPAMSDFLVRRLASSIPSNIDFTSAQAIIIPSADTAWDGADTVGLMTLQRLASAARLYRRLQLPIVVSGGPENRGASLASLMQRELEQNFNVPVRFAETTSQNTFENAHYTSMLMHENNIISVIIVAQTRDMPRLLWSFKRVGLDPAPYPFDERSEPVEIEDFLPSAKAFLESFYAVHEMIGIAYYRIVY